MSSGSHDPETTPTVIRISPMALVGVGFLTLAQMSLVLAEPKWFTATLILPVIAAVAIFRYRTVADGDTVTARGFFSSRTVAWTEIDGLRFDRKSWALARLRDGSEFRLPGVTFSTLPELTEASNGRVPNPYL